MKTRILNCEIRKKSDVEKTRTIEFVASDETRDSYGTVLKATNWDLERFNSNGVIGYQHNVYGAGLFTTPNPDDVIGKGEARIEGDKLIVAITFEPRDLNEQADKIFRKILFGSLKAVSVGFGSNGGHYGKGDEAEGASNETYYFDSQELYEVSVVNIPANKNALKRGMRSDALQALEHIYNALGGEYSIKELSQMKMSDILEMLEGERIPTRSAEENDLPKIGIESIEIKEAEEEPAEVEDLSELTIAKANLALYN